eukprot:268719-Rhodomonas_salina.8
MRQRVRAGAQRDPPVLLLRPVGRRAYDRATRCMVGRMRRVRRHGRRGNTRGTVSRSQRPSHPYMSSRPVFDALYALCDVRSVSVRSYHRTTGWCDVRVRWLRCVRLTRYALLLQP